MEGRHSSRYLHSFIALSFFNSVGLQIFSVATQVLWNSTKITSLNLMTPIHLHPLPRARRLTFQTQFWGKDRRMNMQLLLILKFFTDIQMMLILPHRRSVTSACLLGVNSAISNHKILRPVSWRSCMAMGRTKETPGGYTSPLLYLNFLSQMLYFHFRR